MSYKKAYIETHVEAYIDEMAKVMKNNLKRVLNSGALDIDSFNPEKPDMFLPKAITQALIINYSQVIKPKPSQFEEHQKEVRNILKFI